MKPLKPRLLEKHKRLSDKQALGNAVKQIYRNPKSRY